MSNTMTKSQSFLTAACLGSRAQHGPVMPSLGWQPGGAFARSGGTERVGGNGRLENGHLAELVLRPRGLRDEQRFHQDKQGLSVFADQRGGIQAPATADVYLPSVKGGMSGPHPWRRPV
ncbi:hypothetical protein ACFVH6_16540 [Spirillospora sp. NPDC127200]